MTLIPISQILPNPQQPRRYFDQAALGELAQSIKENGVIQPVVVEEAAKDRYILHDGERRLRASKLAGLTEIPAVVVPSLNGTGKHDRLVRALVANIQRQDLTPIEEGQSFKALVDMGETRNAIALALGISSARVASRLQLLELEPPIQDLIGAGRLSKDNRLVESLLKVPTPEARVKLAKSLSARNATIKAGVEACERLTHALQAQAIPADEVPALSLAQKRKGTLNRPIWDAFSQVGKAPPWPLVEVCVRDTCNRCALRETASATTCSGCPMVEMLIQMIGSTR